jgi:hypothetical protein
MWGEKDQAAKLLGYDDDDGVEIKEVKGEDGVYRY